MRIEKISERAMKWLHCVSFFQLAELVSVKSVVSVLSGLSLVARGARSGLDALGAVAALYAGAVYALFAPFGSLERGRPLMSPGFQFFNPILQVSQPQEA